MEHLLSQIGTRLRARRTDWDLTQAELAKRAGVSPRFLVQLEKGEGNISVGRLAEVCGALDLPLADLFRGIGPGRPTKIALVGLRGAGKSTVGERLSDVTGSDFIELDALIEQEAGMSLREVFELRGEAHYRTLEREVLERVLRTPGAAVIAAGGSIVTAHETWRRLQEGARTVWLQALRHRTLSGFVPKGTFARWRGGPMHWQSLRQFSTSAQVCMLRRMSTSTRMC